MLSQQCRRDFPFEGGCDRLEKAEARVIHITRDVETSKKISKHFSVAASDHMRKLHGITDTDKSSGTGQGNCRTAEVYLACLVDDQVIKHVTSCDAMMERMCRREDHRESGDEINEIPPVAGCGEFLFFHALVFFMKCVLYKLHRITLEFGSGRVAFFILFGDPGFCDVDVCLYRFELLLIVSGMKPCSDRVL